MRLSVEIPEGQAQQLREAAGRLGVGLEQLAQAAIAGLANQQAADFESAMARVPRKNEQLYRRFA